MKSEIINFSDVFINNSNPLNYSDLQRIFTSEIIKIRNKYSNMRLDTMILGIRLLNYISDAGSFSKFTNVNIVDNIDYFEVGIYCGFHVYLDDNIGNDIIYLTVDKNKLRDIKIDNIIGDETNIEDYIIQIEVRDMGLI